MFDEIFADCNLIKEYENLCEKDEWNIFYQRIKNKSSIKIGDIECSVSRSVSNRLKNTFREVVPYDFNRVLLSRSSEDGNDYINGSNILLHGRSYIMTQYPNSATIELFWTMVWQSRTPGLIMLGKLFDGENVNYFPEFNNEIFVSNYNNMEDKTFRILTKEQIPYDGFIQRKLQLYNVEVDESMDLWHFEFWSWPDQCVPRCMESFLTLLGVVRKYNIVNTVTNPPIVHCSAGAGRSGTFCLIDIAITLMEQDGDINNINIPLLMEDLRAQRMGIIRTFAQLRFCYEAVIEAFKKYKAKNRVNDLYLLMADQPHFCDNYNSKTASSSCSDEADLDTVLYYQLSEESDLNTEGNDLSFLTDQELIEKNFNCNNYNDSSVKDKDTFVNDLECQTICRQRVLFLRKLKNIERISELKKHLQDQSLKRYRLVSRISSGLVDDLTSDKCRSIIVIAGLAIFMGTFFWHKYSTFKCN